MKIALVIASLQSGGAERVAINLAHGFANDGNQVSLITLSSPQTDFYDLPKVVDRVALDCMIPSDGLLNGLRNNRKRVLLIRDALRGINPEVTISFCTETNVLVLLAARRLLTKVVITEHLDPQKTSYGFHWELLRRWVYPHADQLVSVSKGVQQGFDWMPVSKRVVIYNPISVSSPPNKLSAPQVCDSSKKWITSMGRLEHQKGFDILIDAVGLAREGLEGWQVCLIGDGPLRGAIETKIREMNLGDLVVLTGRLKNPHDVIRRSKLFVMSSRFEGFPMAHAEALMCGVPVVATNCPSGPSEMIEHGVNGLLVPPEDTDSLSRAMLCVMNDVEMQTRMAHAALGIKNRLGLAPIMRQWQDLFDRF